MTDTNNNRSWEMLMDRLKGIEDNQNRLLKCVASLSVDVAQLKIKAGIWGLIGGSIPICTALLIWLLRTL